VEVKQDVPPDVGVQSERLVLDDLAQDKLWQVLNEEVVCDLQDLQLLDEVHREVELGKHIVEQDFIVFDSVDLVVARAARAQAQLLELLLLVHVHQEEGELFGVHVLEDDPVGNFGELLLLGSAHLRNEGLDLLNIFLLQPNSHRDLLGLPRLLSPDRPRRREVAVLGLVLARWQDVVGVGVAWLSLENSFIVVYLQRVEGPSMLLHVAQV